MGQRWLLWSSSQFQLAHPLTAIGSTQNMRCDVQKCPVAADVSVELAPQGTPYNRSGRQGQKYKYRQTDTRTPRVPGQSSGQGQGFGEASPEPGLGAGVGVVTDSDEPQDAGELFLHCFVFDGGGR